MPPLAVVWLEAVGKHCLPENHTVFILLLVDGLIGAYFLSRLYVGMRGKAKVVVGTSHIHLLL